MARIRKENIIKSLEFYLYFNFLHLKKLFIQRDKNFIWAFDDVNNQLCFLKIIESSIPSTFNTTILNRKAESLDLILLRNSEVKIASSDFLGNPKFSKTVITIPKKIGNHNILNYNKHLVDDISILQKLEINYQIADNLKSVIEKFKNLIKIPSIEALAICDTEERELLGLLLYYSFENSTLIDINLSREYSNSELLDFSFNEIKTKIQDERISLIVVLDSFAAHLKQDLNKIFKIDFFNRMEIQKNTLVPVKVASNSVLKSKGSYQHTIRELNKLGLPLHEDRPKNWDSFSALSIILHDALSNDTGVISEHNILDAGGEIYSSILHQLSAYGFRNLHSINLAFEKKFKVGNISYEPGDITKTRFKDDYFYAVTCLSVIEHGVDLEEYFQEMSRILKPNGLLFTSADYWESKIDSDNKQAYGKPIKIFSKKEIFETIKIAQRYNLHLVEKKIDTKSKNRLIEDQGLHYTFIYFTLRKMI